MSYEILIVDDEEIIRDNLSYVLEAEGFIVDKAENGFVAYNKVKEKHFDLIITDIEMPSMKGTELLEKVKALDPQTAVIIITAFGSLETAISALRNGASDYILKPIEFDELILKAKRLFEIKEILIENKILREEIQRQYDFENIIGKSAAIKNVFEMIKAVADTESTVLISGKSGTGKELVAKAIHFNSRRRNKRFVAVNCGAISENLIESELFGHRKGAFTGAISDKEGYIKAAEGGTLFLDEISEMPPQLQVKLLRAIQEKEYTPVGTTISLPANVRFIATTNRNLEEEVKNGRFREDLYYRINVVEIHLPSLREREDDIPLLANHFVDMYRKKLNKNIKGIDNDAMRALINHEWKGEVRELENIIERAVIFCKNDFIGVEDLPQSIVPSKGLFNFTYTGSLEESVKKFEREYIIKALQKNEYNKEKTAEDLNVGLSTLYRKLKEMDIQI